MNHPAPYLAMFAAFVLGASVCDWGSRHVSHAQIAVIPDASVLPSVEFMTVEDAYAAIPHRNTGMPNRWTGVKAQERDYMKLALQLIDLGIVARVSACQEAEAGHEITAQLAAFNALSEQLDEVQPPTSLAHYHSLLSKALVRQAEYLRELGRDMVLVDDSLRTSAFDHAASHAVVKASECLHAAYNELLQRFPELDAQARDALFDHHCALDFI